VPADNTAIVQQLYGAFGSGNIDAFLDGLTEGIVWESRYTHDIPVGGVFTGKEEIRRFMASIGEHVDIFEFVPATFLANENHVVVLGHEVASPKTTGVRYRNEWVHVFRFNGGKVDHIQTSNDVAAVQAAFNAV